MYFTDVDQTQLEYVLKIKSSPFSSTQLYILIFERMIHNFPY